MKNRYRINLPGFENVVIVGELNDQIGLWVESVETEDTGTAVYGKLWVSKDFVRLIPEGVSDYGEELYHAEFHKGGIDVTYARYTKCTTVTVRETARGFERTLYAQNFWDEKADEAVKCVERVMRDGLDPDDLILELKENE